MNPLLFRCPRTRRAIDAGIQMDKNTLATASPVMLQVYCYHCCGTHALPLKLGSLSEDCVQEVLDEPEPPKAPALAIAINALRIFWLQRGLPPARPEANS